MTRSQVRVLACAPQTNLFSKSVMYWTRGARGGSDQNRTLGESPTHWRVRQQPRKKNAPCFLDLAGVKFLLKKERMFFFRGSALQVFGQCVGLQYGLGKAKKLFFWGKGFFALPRLISLPQEGSGEECGRDSKFAFGFFRRA